MTLNSYNTKGNGGVDWGRLDIQITLHVSFKEVYFCFAKALRVLGENTKPLFSA